MNKMIKLTAFFIACGLTLSACSGAKETFGLSRHAPDEFAVVKRAPLAMPPDYALRPPQPGMPRPQEAAMDEQAREVIFGAKTSAASSKSTSGETALLQEAGSAQALPAIREIVNRESAALVPKEKPVAEKLLGWASSKKEAPPATVVDAAAEAQRLKDNAADGKSVTEGATPTVKE